jgi:hypothetical protein
VAYLNSFGAERVLRAWGGDGPCCSFAASRGIPECVASNASNWCWSCSRGPLPVEEWLSKTRRTYPEGEATEATVHAGDLSVIRRRLRALIDTGAGPPGPGRKAV